LISETIDNVLESVNEIDLIQAKRAVENSLMNKFDTNKKIAATFIFLDKYNFPTDYFDNRVAQIEKIKLADVKNSVKNILNSDDMIVVNVGRIKG